MSKMDQEFTLTARRVSLVCMISNLGLALLKTIGGILASSKALISDGINSIFDVISGVIVITGTKMSRLTADDDHPYGHERLESVASVILSILLFITAIFIGHTAIEDLTSGAYLEREVPQLISIVYALISIATKEVLFWYTKSNAERINSLALRASAYDHRSDMISTGFALLGVMLSRYGFPICDLIASLIVCFFIAKTAYTVFREAIGQMVDRACDEETQEEIRTCILSQPGVLGIDLLQIRTFGNKLYVDLEISEDENVCLKEAHQVAEKVHNEVEKRFSDVKHIMIHVNPKKAD